MESEGRKGAVTTKKEKPSAWRKQDPGRICSESWQELTPSPLKNRIEVMATRAGRQARAYPLCILEQALGPSKGAHHFLLFPLPFPAAAIVSGFISWFRVLGLSACCADRMKG